MQYKITYLHFKQIFDRYVMELLTKDHADWKIKDIIYANYSITVVYDVYEYWAEADIEYETKFPLALLGIK